jgi:hypothetical protein
MQWPQAYDLEVGAMNNLWDAIRKRRVLVIIGLLLAVGLGTSAAIFGPRLFTGNQPAQAADAANTANATSKTDGSATSKPVGFSEFRNEQAGFELAYPSD